MGAFARLCFHGWRSRIHPRLNERGTVTDSIAGFKAGERCDFGAQSE
jgi:hypothetical protein